MFSIVRKNKTENRRSSLKLEGTLSNLVAMKLQYPEQTVPCPVGVLEKNCLRVPKRQPLHIIMSSDPNL